VSQIVKSTGDPRSSFTGETAGGVFDAILHKEPTLPMRLNTAVPAELQRVIGKAMEKDRELRYHSAGIRRSRSAFGAL
jgi:eukaryotic-like serine/threonine-protein kinase